MSYYSCDHVNFTGSPLKIGQLRKRVMDTDNVCSVCLVFQFARKITIEST